MKRFAISMILVIIALLLSAGCTQSSPAVSPQPTLPPATTETALPALTAVPAAPVTTVAAQVAVTVIHYIEPAKAWKDTSFHMRFSTPGSWNVSTRRLSLPEGSQGLEYQTDLVANDVFFIRTYPISRNQDQAYRDTFRKWDPAPVETTVTLNGITYERFESSKDGKTYVGYVVQKASANDVGFANVIVFIADDSRRFEKEDFETVVASFAYFTTAEASGVTGEEIPRIR
jgi:hypothetical protein